MRRLWLLALVFSASVSVIVLLAVGVVHLSNLNPSHPAVAAGSTAVSRLRSAVGQPLEGGNVLAAEGTPVPQYVVDHRSDMTVYHDLVYGHVGDQDLVLDAYIPAGGPHPAVVVIHGGGWAHGSKEELNFEGEGLAMAGFSAFVVNYRMAPPGGDWHAPIALEDVRTAVLWVRQNAATYNADPNRVGALGNSAGGNLAMMLGTTGMVGADRVEAVVSFSGQSNLMTLSTEHTIHAATNYIGCSSTECPKVWIDNSPIDHCDHSTSPMLIVNSTHELMPLDQATGMAAKLDEIGVPHELRILNGDKHASAYAGQVWTQALTFFQHYLSRSSGSS